MSPRGRGAGAAFLIAGLLLTGCRQPDRTARPAPASRATPEPGRREVTDMLGTHVQVPAGISRVATIDDGLVESVMVRLGTIGSLVALGSPSQNRQWSYSFQFRDGRSFSADEGLGTVRALHPWLADLPCASVSGEAISYETIAAARPEVVVVRAGDCTVGADPDVVNRTAGMIRSLGIPVVVLRAQADVRGQGPGLLRDEIEMLGRLFGREREAAALAEELAEVEAFVRTRVADVPDGARPRALYLGLASAARSSGGAAYVWGVETVESRMIESLAGARNAYRGLGAKVLLNTEQILALDPDVIFLPTSAGYHPPEELAEAPYFRELQRLRAVRERRVYALPWTPMNCARRLEYPLDLMVMAKGAFPDRFRDVAVHERALSFYQRTYRIDVAAARVLRRAQWLEWAVEAGF